jgi:predicted nucleotidyltransferase
MGIDEILAGKRDDILRIAAKHGVGDIRVFGSVARGEAGPQSDVDFLIEIIGDTPPWFPGGLIADLEDLLGRRVDVVAPSWLNEIIKAGVLAEAVPL